MGHIRQSSDRNNNQDSEYSITRDKMFHEEIKSMRLIEKINFLYFMNSPFGMFFFFSVFSTYWLSGNVFFLLFSISLFFFFFFSLFINSIKYSRNDEKLTVFSVFLIYLKTDAFVGFNVLLSFCLFSFFTLIFVYGFILYATLFIKYLPLLLNYILPSFIVEWIF